MIRLLLRVPSVPREDGAVENRILAPMFRSEFTSSQFCSVRTWLNFLQGGGGPRKRFPHCLDLYSERPFYTFEQFKATGELINPTWQDNVLLPSDFAEYVYHVGSSHDMHCIIRSGLISGGKDIEKGVTDFTSVNLVSIRLHKQRDSDVTKPRICSVQTN